MRDLEIQQLIMQEVDSYTGLQGSCQPRYENYSYPQRLSQLNANLKVHVLREAGDYKKYLALQKEVFNLVPTQVSSEDRAIYEIISWLDAKLGAVTPDSQENSFVISLLAFGDEYVQKFVDFTAPSLLAQGNLPYLTKEKNITVYLHTDKKGHELIDKSSAIEKFRELGIQVEYVIIPEELLIHLKNPTIIYWLLGASASLGLHYAKALHATFHHSYPDLVYSDKFFSELHRLSKQHTSILGGGMRSDETLIMPRLEKYRNGYTLAVPSADLMAHHMDCIHMCSWAMVSNNRPNFWTYPQSHVIIWESEEMVHINSPHLMAHWVDYSVIKNLPVRFYMTLDSEMDLLCKNENYYVIQEDDEVYQIELSRPDRQAREDRYCDELGAAELLWSCVSHRDTMKFFFREMKIKLNRAIRPAPSNMMLKSHVEILQIHLYNTILSRDPYSTVQLARGRTHNGYLFR